MKVRVDVCSVPPEHWTFLDLGANTEQISNQNRFTTVWLFMKLFLVKTDTWAQRRTLNVMKISFLPTGILTVWPFSTPNSKNRVKITKTRCIYDIFSLNNKMSSHNNHCIVRKHRLTSRYRNHHRLLLFGLAPPTARPTGVGDDRSFAAALTASGAHDKRTRGHGLLQGWRHACSEMQRKDALKEPKAGGALTMPEPLQAGQRCTLLPGSWPLPLQSWQAASILTEISLLTPFAAWVNVSSIMYCIPKENKSQVFKCKARWERRNSFLSSFIDSNLLGVIKYGIEIPIAPATREFPKDLAEELLRINAAGLSAPVVLPSSGLTGVKARCAVRIVLLPFDFITQDLRGDKFTYFKSKCLQTGTGKGNFGE